MGQFVCVGNKYDTRKIVSCARFLMSCARYYFCIKKAPFAETHLLMMSTTSSGGFVIIENIGCHNNLIHGAFWYFSF